MTDLLTPIRGQRLDEAIALGQEHGVNIYARIMLNTDVAAWTRAYPDEPPPLQPLDEQEQAIVDRLRSSDPETRAFHQFGGEPTDTRDLYPGEMLSFHDSRVMDLMKAKIRQVVSTPGLTGIALDGWGYRNLRCDRSSAARAAFEQYRRTRTTVPEHIALREFSRDRLVQAFNDLADYARSLRPDIKITNHCWPSFADEELYGNRLDIEFPGMTAAWFTLWPLDKVETHARLMVRHEKTFFQRPRAVALIAYYNLPEQFPEKSAARIEVELKAILAGGCDRLQVANINHVLTAPDVAEVFRRYCLSPDH